MHLNDLTPRPTAKKMNKIMESRFGFSLDYSKLNMNNARQLNTKLRENMEKMRNVYGIHKVEKNPKYMELLMVREALQSWMSENTRQINESEFGQNKVVFATMDIVDRIQDMAERIGKIQVEQLPSLIDAIRDQIGDDQANAYQSAVGQLIDTLVDQITTARNSADSAARALAGGQIAPMKMPSSAMSAPSDPEEMPEGPENEAESDIDAGEETPDEDEFGAMGAAAGGTSALGREKR